MTVTRNSLIQKFTTKQATLLDDFSDQNSWNTLSNCTKAADTVNKLTGTNSTQLTTTSATGTPGTMDKNLSSVSFGQTTKQVTVKFFIQTDPTATINQVIFYFGAVAWTKYFNVALNGGNLKAGWNFITLFPDLTQYTGGGSWNDLLVKMRMAVKPVNGQTAIVTFDSITYDSVSIPKIVLTFDDEWQSVYDNAFPYMQQKGIRGTMYTVPSFLGTTYYMTKLGLDDLHNAGWCIANHTWEHAFYKTQNWTVNDYKTSVQKTQAWLNQNGYRGANHIAYPKGEYDINVIQAMKDLGMKTGRNIVPSYQSHIVDDPYQLTIQSLYSSVTLATAKTYIDAVINSGGTLFIMMHQIVPDDTVNTITSQPSLCWSTAKFQGLIDYIAERKVECVTTREWWEGLKNPRFREVPLVR